MQHIIGGVLAGLTGSNCRLLPLQVSLAESPMVFPNDHTTRESFSPSSHFTPELPKRRPHDAIPSSRSTWKLEVHGMNTSPAPLDTAHDASQPEARLRAEFAGKYPEIQAGIWMNPHELAKKLVDRAHARRRQGLYTRTFDPRHFQFRGLDLRT